MADKDDREKVGSKGEDWQLTVVNQDYKNDPSNITEPQAAADSIPSTDDTPKKDSNWDLVKDYLRNRGK